MQDHQRPSNGVNPQGPRGICQAAPTNAFGVKFYNKISYHAHGFPRGQSHGMAAEPTRINDLSNYKCWELLETVVGHLKLVH